jgi:hypothetical protein
MHFVAPQPSPSPELYLITDETVNMYQQWNMYQQLYMDVEQVVEDPSFTVNMMVLPAERCHTHLAFLFALFMMVSFLCLVSRSRRAPPTVVVAEAVESDVVEKGIVVEKGTVVKNSRV